MATPSSLLASSRTMASLSPSTVDGVARPPPTRSTILAWVNVIFESAYATLVEVPPHEVALLLYGAFCGSGWRDAGDVDDSASPSGEMRVLCGATLWTHAQQHRTTCTRYLQLLQFPSLNSAETRESATAAVGVGGAERDSNNNGGGGGGPNRGLKAVAQLRNAEHVLAMVRALSNEEAILLRTEAAGCASSITGDGVVSEGLVLGPLMTPTAWLAGSAFVEELKLWRWVHRMAAQHSSTASSIRSAIQAYLRSGEVASLESERTACHTPSALPTQPNQPVGIHNGAVADPPTTKADEAISEMKRRRLELSEEALPIEQGNTEAHSSDAANATASPYVEQAPRLQVALQAAQLTLRDELLRAEAHRQSQASSSPSCDTSARNSGTSGPSGAAATSDEVRAAIAAPSMNPAEALAESRQRQLVARVVDGLNPAQGDNGATPLLCEVCPSLVAHAIQGNLLAIEAMEATRRRAVAACLARDPTALLAALQNIL